MLYVVTMSSLLEQPLYDYLTVILDISTCAYHGQKGDFLLALRLQFYKKVGQPLLALGIHRKVWNMWIKNNKKEFETVFLMVLIICISVCTSNGKQYSHERFMEIFWGCIFSLYCIDMYHCQTYFASCMHWGVYARNVCFMSVVLCK